MKLFSFRNLLSLGRISRNLGRIADALERAYPPPQERHAKMLTEHDLSVIDPTRLDEIEFEEEQKRMTGELLEK